MIKTKRLVLINQLILAGFFIGFNKSYYFCNEILFAMKHPFEQFLFCPKCGSNNFKIATEKSKLCNKCGFHYFFNPSAAVVGLIMNEKDELLVCRRAKEPAKGTLDIAGGFVDCYETAEEAVIREIKEETELDVTNLEYLFSLPNIYPFSGFEVHTVDLFFRCKVRDTNQPKAQDDVDYCKFIPINEVNIEDFGLKSIREGVAKFIAQYKNLH